MGMIKLLLFIVISCNAIYILGFDSNDKKNSENDKVIDSKGNTDTNTNATPILILILRIMELERIS
jgi:hypothetical protein